MNKIYDKITWHNNTTPALNEDNLNAMSEAIDGLDDRILDLVNIVIQMADVTMLPEGSTPYVTNTGTNMMPVFHLYIPIGAHGTDGVDGVDGVSPAVTITNITDGHRVTITDKDHPSGQNFDVPNGEDGVSPDIEITNITGGHRVTITDLDHPSGQSFDVMNGDGAGDMLTADYDSLNIVANAGGISDYVSANAMTKNGSNAASEVKFAGAFTVGARSTGSTVGTNSACEGRQNVASGDCTHAEGRGCDATGENAHAEGCGTEASNEYTHAEGLNAVASGPSSHAEGSNSTASNSSAHAEGLYTTASGLNSHSECEHTTASGRASHAEGGYTTASGEEAHSEGYYTTASGDYSHASGNHTTAAYANQTSIGKYNINYAHHLFAIGNGTDSSHKKNVFEVWNTGDVSFDNGTTRFRMRRIKETVTLSTSADTNVTFIDIDYIDSNAVLSVYTDVFGMNPTNMSVSDHTCTVTFPKVDTAATINVILEISGTMSQVI